MCYNSSQLLVGLIIVHVDDLLMSFNMKDNEAMNKIQEIRKAFDFGKWQELKQGEDIIYCGGRISKHGQKVNLDFEDYMKKVMPITIHKGRAQKDPLTASEVSKARALIGALQWPAGQGCPFLNASTSLTAATINKATVELLSELNKTLRFAKQNAEFKMSMTAVCNGFGNDVCLLCFSDAAFNVRSDGSSQGGYIVVMTSSRALQGEHVPYNVISWRSFKLTRVCRSSLSAESQACATALDELMMVKTMIALMINPDLDPMSEETAATCCKSAIIVDAKALFDSLKRDGIGSAADKRAGIEILCIKEEIKRLRTELRWVSSERMLADGLTKSHTRQQLAEMLKSGWLSIVHDENYVAAKKKNKEERQASTAQTFGYTNQVAARISMVVALSNVAQTSAQNMTEVGEHVGVLESYVTDYAVDYALIVTVISLIVGTPLIAVVLWKCMCKWCRFITTLYRQAKMIQLLMTENIELKEEVERSRDELYRIRQRIVRMRVGLCFYTEGGTRWHCYNDCRTIRNSQRVLNKDGMCRICWEKLLEDTAGDVPTPPHGWNEDTDATEE